MQATTDPTGGNCNIGWTDAGEWLEFDLSTASGGSFDVALRLAANDGGRTVTALLDSVNVGTITAPALGWQTFESRALSAIAVPAGVHTLRLVFNSGAVNLNYLNITAASTSPRVPVPARIEAENYARANELSPASNSGGACDRGDGVDMQGTTDPTGGNCNIGWTDAGEWVEFDVDAGSGGMFDLVARAGSGSAEASTFRFVVDGVQVGSNITVANNGWQAFADYTVPGVVLGPGAHTIRFRWVTSGVNLNYIRVVATTVQPTNLLLNPNFDANLAGWSVYVNGADTADAISWNAGTALFGTNGTTNPIWWMQLLQTFPATAGQSYTFGVDLATTGTSARAVQIYIQEDGGDWTLFGARDCAVPGTGSMRCELSATILETVPVKFGIQGADNLTDFTVDNAVLILN
jgi:hypothetical protein